MPPIQGFIPNQQLSTQMQLLAAMPVHSVPYCKVGSSYWQPFAPNDVGHEAANAALGNTATLAIWTPAGGNVFWVKVLVITCQTAGLLQITNNGVIQLSFNSLALTSFVVPLPPLGLSGLVAGGVLGVRNFSGGAVNIFASALGVEVTF